MFSGINQPERASVLFQSGSVAAKGWVPLLQWSIRKWAPFLIPATRLKAVPKNQLWVKNFSRSKKTYRGLFGSRGSVGFPPFPANSFFVAIGLFCSFFVATVEALNIASATKAHVDTISVASPAACGPLSPSYNVEAKRVTLLPRPNRLQVQHCIRGRGPQISCHSSSLSGPCPLAFCSALAIFRASTVSRRPSVVFGPAPSLRTVCLSAREDFGETCLGPQPTHAYNLQGFGDACLRADM